MARIYDHLFEEWLEMLDNYIHDKEIVKIESIKENNNDILNFKVICKEITKNENEKDLENNILYECKNPKCDDDEVVNENDYCNYCKKDLKNCKLCNIEFVNDELDVKYCEDCNETIEMEGYYSDDE